MGSALEQLATVEHENQIRTAKEAKAVGNDESRPAFHCQSES
jgi:hypothetical protein